MYILNHTQTLSIHPFIYLSISCDVEFGPRSIHISRSTAMQRYVPSVGQSLQPRTVLHPDQFCTYTSYVLQWQNFCMLTIFLFMFDHNVA